LVWKEKVIRGYDWSMLKCIPKAGIDQLFQLISNPGTAQHRLKIEKQQAKRKKKIFLSQTFFFHMQHREWSSKSSSKNSSDIGMPGVVLDMSTPHIPVQFHPVSRMGCQGCVPGLSMRSLRRGWGFWWPLIFLDGFEEKEQMRLMSHCILDCKPALHINQSHCIFPSLTMAKKSSASIPNPM